MAKFAGLRDPVTMDFEGSSIAYCIDAICISFGALMGVSPVTAYIESATGISGTFYLDFIGLFRTLTHSMQRVERQELQPWQSALCSSFRSSSRRYSRQSLHGPLEALWRLLGRWWFESSSNLCITEIWGWRILQCGWNQLDVYRRLGAGVLDIAYHPTNVQVRISHHFRCQSDLFLAYSIAYGVIAGIVSYIILNGIPLIIKKLSNGRIVPSEYKYSEKWVVPPGSVVPPFMYASIFFILYCVMRIHASSAAWKRSSSKTSTRVKASTRLWHYSKEKPSQKESLASWIRTPPHPYCRSHRCRHAVLSHKCSAKNKLTLMV